MTSVLTVVLAGLAAAGFVVVRNAEHDQLSNRGFLGAFTLLNSVRKARPKGHGEVRGIVEGFEAEGIRSVAIIGKHGVVLAASDPERVGDFISTSRFQEARKSGEVWSGFIETPIGEPSFRMFVPVKRMMGMRRWKHRRGPPPPWGGFEPKEMVVGIEVAADESFWLWKWAWAQAMVCLVVAAALWLAFVRTRRAVAEISALEAEARRREELARLGEMSAVLAHELRNPLGSLKGHLQLAMESLGTDSDRSTSDRLKTTLGEVTRIEALVRGLLDYAGDRPIRRVPANAADILREAVDLARTAFDLPSLVPEIEVADSLQLTADPDQLVRALANVVQNAIEATRADGTVHVRAEDLGDRVVFVVEDSGNGIDGDVLERIFEPFVTGKIRGIGLGLAIARQVAEAHGGNIEAGRSPDLHGAKISLTIPGK